MSSLLLETPRKSWEKKLLPPTISGIGIYVHLVHLQVSRRYLSTSPSVCKRRHAQLSITATVH